MGRGASPQVGDAHPRSAEVDTGRRSDDDRIYVISDNLSAHKGSTIRDWAHRNNVELCFTPTYSSWANPIEAHSGPLREFVLNNPNHPNHIVLTRRLHAYLRWRNAKARPTPATPTSSPPNAANAPESEQTKATHGAEQPHKPHDPRARTFVDTALAPWGTIADRGNSWGCQILTVTDSSRSPLVPDTVATSLGGVSFGVVAFGSPAATFGSQWE